MADDTPRAPGSPAALAAGAPKPPLAERVRIMWASASYGVSRPVRLVFWLAVAGAVAGLGEAAIIMLVIAMAAGGSGRFGMFGDFMPTDIEVLMFLALGAVAAVALSHWLSARTATRATADVRQTVQNRLIDAWFAAPWATQVLRTPAELQHLVGVDVAAVAIGARTASGALSAVFYLAVVLVAAFLIGPYTVLALGLALAFIVALGRPIRRARRPLVRRAVEAQRILNLEVSELGGATRELRVFGVVSRARHQLSGTVSSAAADMRRYEYQGLIGGPLVRDLTLALVIVALAVIQSTTTVTLSALGATVLLLMRALGQAQMLANTGVVLQERAVQRERIEAAIAEWAPEHPPGTIAAPMTPTITLEDVDYRHPGARRNALTGICLELRHGELVGIIGRSGAGKTTLASLVLGLYTPTHGHVRLDGIDLREIDPDTWQRRTAWVGQDPQLLTGTLADNIRFFREGLDDDVLLRAALDAGLGAELAQWPDGLEHPVGHGGATLSGGQRQRVAIARALAGDPRVLVLDEPTSALDVHAEATVRDLLGTLRGRALIVVIAHRLSTLRACDRIAVLDQGRLVRVAPPRELRENEAYFREVLTLSSAEPIA